jgi:lysozyme
MAPDLPEKGSPHPARIRSGRGNAKLTLKAPPMTNSISAQGLALIQAHEGFRAEPAQLPDGNWVVGYSHVRVGEAGDPVNQDEAAELLKVDVAPVEKLVNARVTQPLNQTQFDSLVSFAFSISAEAFEQSQTLRRVNAGDHMAAACSMDAWRKSDVGGEPQIVDVLVRRRAAEKALYLQELALEAPSVFVRAKLDHAAAILGAPVTYARAPAVGSIPVAQPKAEPAVVITEILKSESATEALLLTQVVPDDVVDEGEIVTAHAKPVARSIEEARAAARRAQAAVATEGVETTLLFKPMHVIKAGTPPTPVDHRLRNARRRAEHNWLPQLRTLVFENVALFALMVFGFALLTIAVSLGLNANGAPVELGAAAGVAIPGLLAVVLAVIGLRRSHRPVDVEPANA